MFAITIELEEQLVSNASRPFFVLVLSLIVRALNMFRGPAGKPPLAQALATRARHVYPLLQILAICH